MGKNCVCVLRSHSIRRRTEGNIRNGIRKHRVDAPLTRAREKKKKKKKPGGAREVRLDRYNPNHSRANGIQLVTRKKVCLKGRTDTVGSAFCCAFKENWIKGQVSRPKGDTMLGRPAQLAMPQMASRMSQKKSSELLKIFSTLRRQK